MDLFFAEELGLVLEVGKDNLENVLSMYKEASVPCSVIGHSATDGPSSKVNLFLKFNEFNLQFVWHHKKH